MSCIKTAAISLAVLIPGLVIEHATAADDSQLLISSTAAISSIASDIEATIDAGDIAQSDIDQLLFLYKDARSAGLWGEADTLAKRIVNTAIRSDGIDSRVTAVALTNLANLQTSKDDNVS